MGRKHKYVISGQKNKYTKLLEVGYRCNVKIWLIFISCYSIKEVLNLCESQQQNGNDNAKLSYFSVTARLKINLK